MKVPAAFPAAPMYTRSISDAIKAQFRFNEGSIANEADPSRTMELTDVSVVRNALETGEDGKFAFDCEYFGANDFTIEAKITFYSWGNANVAQPSYVFGQYNNEALNVPTNSWNLRVHNGVLHWVERRGTTTTATPTTVTAERFAFQLNREYHVVVERVGGTVSLYVNGAFYTSLASTTPLTNSPAPVMSEQIDPGTFTNGYGRCSRRIRDIRIASRALYRGNIYDNFSGIREAESKPWWQGSVVAYDSECLTLDDSNNFRDYNGVLMKAGKTVLGFNGSLPQRAGSDFQYGEGILISNGSYIVTNTGELLQSFSSYSWTLDFWHREVDEGKTGRSGIFPIINYPNVEVSTTYSTRLLIGPASGDVNSPLVDRYTVWSNAQNPAATGIVPVNLEGVEWKHTAIVYDADSKRLQFYSNGIFTGFMAVTVHPITVLNQFGIGSSNVNRPVLIERYRLRLGMHFNGQFNPDNSY